MTTIPAVANNVKTLASILTDIKIWGLPASNCTVIHDPQSVDAVLTPIHDAAKSAKAALLVYFAGHGLLDDASDLYLGLPDSNKERLHRSVRYGEIRREVVVTARDCNSKIIILDCCYSGRAMSGFMSDSTQLANQAAVDGAYLMTATAETALAIAPVGARYTAFTGALLNTLHNGIPGGPELLDMETLFTKVEHDLRSQCYPTPQNRSRESGHRITIARNRAFEPSTARSLNIETSATTPDTSTTSTTSGPYVPELNSEITDPTAQIEALQRVGEMLRGPLPSPTVLAEAETLARRIARPSAREAMFTTIAISVALHDPTHSIRLANTITDPRRRSEALRGIAHALASKDMTRARDVLAMSEHIDTNTSKTSDTY